MIASQPRRRHRASGWTHARQLAFARDLRTLGTISACCARIGLSRASLYQLRARDKAFDRLCSLALAAYRDDLLQEAAARAMRGEVRPTRYRGRIVGERVVYDNRLLAAALFAGNRTYGGLS